MSADPLDPRADGLRRSGRPPLQAEHITAVALSLVDEGGPQALTLRSLAARLGSSTATLYRHFADRATLIDTVVDAVFGEVDVTSHPGEHWDAALTRMATHLFEAFERHRSILSLLLDGDANAPRLLRLRGAVLSLLADAGFGPADALLIYAAVGRYVLGYGLQNRVGAAADGATTPPLRPAPGTTAGIDRTATLADEFRFGLRMMIAGLRCSYPAMGTPEASTGG